MIRYRLLERRDLVNVHGFPQLYPVEGIVAEENGRMVALGGIERVEGRHWCLFHVDPDAAISPYAYHRLVLKGLRCIDEREVFAACDRRIVAAGRWLARLGFSETTETFGDWCRSAGVQLVSTGQGENMVWRIDLTTLKA